MRFMNFVVDGHFLHLHLYFTFLFEIYFLHLYLFIVLYFSGFNQVVILLLITPSFKQLYAALFR